MGRGQTAEGHFPNPVAAEVLAGHGGFSPPMLTYALRRAGWTAAADRAWPVSVRPERASPFDMIGAAYAVREFGAPLTDYMAAYVPKYTGLYSNRKLVEAVAAIAMTDAGVPSPWLEAALRTINEFVPQWARPLMRAGTPGGSIRGAYLSDPVTHPLAYHALSALMLTQVAERLSPAARRTLGETLETLNVLVAPDGAADYFGRGEGNVWVPAVTAAAMVEGAALYPERAGRYLAVAEAAVARLRALHLTPEPRPARGSRRSRRLRGRRLVRAHRRLQRAGAVGARGRRRARRDAPTGRARRVPAAGSLEVADGRSGLAVVGTGRSWMAVRAVRSGANHDLRYGFGLLSLKVREGGGWRDLLAPRPLFEGRPITPAPLLGSRDPGGTRVDTSPGAIAIPGRTGAAAWTSASVRCPTGPSSPSRRSAPASATGCSCSRPPAPAVAPARACWPIARAGGSTPRSRFGATAAGTRARSSTSTRCASRRGRAGTG